MGTGAGGRVCGILKYRHISKQASVHWISKHLNSSYPDCIISSSNRTHETLNFLFYTEAAAQGLPMVRFLLQNLGPDHQAATYPWVLASMGYSSELYQVLQLATTQSVLENIKENASSREKYTINFIAIVIPFAFFFIDWKIILV